MKSYRYPLHHGLRSTSRPYQSPYPLILGMFNHVWPVICRCVGQATFAAEGKSTACFCSEHRSPGMVDVKGRRCEISQCTKQAAFGIPNEKPRFCLHHRQMGMVDVRPRARGTGTATPPGTSSGTMLSDKNDSDLSSNGKGLEPCVEGPRSFAEKWGKRRKSRSGIDAPVGVHGLDVEDGGMDAGGVANPLPIAASSHVDLLRPARRATSPSLNSGQMWFPGNGVSSAVGVHTSAGTMRSSWNLGRTQQLGGSIGPGTSTVGLWSLSGHQVSSSSAASQWMPRPADGQASVGSGAALQSSSQWSHSAYDGGFSSVADETVCYESSSSILPNVSVRSCGSHPAHALSSTSGLNSRLQSSGYASSVSRDGTSRAIMGGEVGVAGDSWRPSTPEPGTFTETLQSPASLLAGMDTHSCGVLGPAVDTASLAIGTSSHRSRGVGLSNSEANRDGASPCANGIASETASRLSAKVRTEPQQLSDATIDEAEDGDGWLQALLMQGMVGRDGCGLDARQSEPLAGDTAGSGAHVGYPSPTLERAVTLPDTRQYTLGRQGIYGAGEHEPLSRSGGASTTSGVLFFT